MYGESSKGDKSDVSNLSDIWQIGSSYIATYGMDSNLFVSKYELYLPDKEELRRMVKTILK